MPDHVLIVLTNPTEGQEDEYNDWYSNTHLAEVTALDGFVAAQRFRLSDSQLSGFPRSDHRFLAIYEIDGDPSRAFELLERELESGRMVLPASINAADIRPWCYTPITDRMTAGEGRAAARA